MMQKCKEKNLGGGGTPIFGPELYFVVRRNLFFVFPIRTILVLKRHAFFAPFLLEC